MYKYLIQCDRCGTEEPGTTIPEDWAVVSIIHKDGQLTFCPECWKKILDFLKL